MSFISIIIISMIITITMTIIMTITTIITITIISIILVDDVLRQAESYFTTDNDATDDAATKQIEFHLSFQR